ncbi:MAG: hypothetical protein Q7S87_05085 [Agitococcus sp.]|nr:hypothetical protein [Agitococcus sp.]
MTKFFALNELEARIPAHLRRHKPQQKAINSHHIHCGEIDIF